MHGRFRPFVTYLHKAHLRRIVTMCFKVFPEYPILFHQTVVRKRADEEECNQCTQDRKTTTDPEGPSIATVSRWATKV
jgi:hypothetical protein